MGSLSNILGHATPPHSYSSKVLNGLRRLEFQEKRARVASFLATHDLDAVWLTRWANYAWLTSGYFAYDVAPRTSGQVSCLATADALHIIIADTKDVAAFTQIATNMGAQLHVFQQQDPRSLPALLNELTGSMAIGTDSEQPGWRHVGKDIDRLRLVLTAAEQSRYRALCHDCTVVLQDAAYGVFPAQAEQEIAADIAQRCYAAGITPTALLVSADSGLRPHRHPPPGEHMVSKFAILVLAGTRGGLHAALTRLVAIDQLPSVIEDKYRAAAFLGAVCVDHALPGETLSDVIRAGMAAYHQNGYPADWRIRFRSDILDYHPREARSLVNVSQRLEPYQAVAWSASMNGLRCEDTYLVLPDCTDTLTRTDDWPVIEFKLDNAVHYRPDILRL